MPNLSQNRNLLVDLLAIFFGISGWIGITSVYLELPLIVDKAPEGWKLPSYIAILVQAGNIANLIYILYEKYSPVKVRESQWIYAMMISGCVAALGLAFLYQQTGEMNGKQHSVWLLIFTGVFAAIGCLSSVLSMPYMGRFKEMYLVTYLFGQGLNAFISSLVALIQGSGGKRDCIITSNSTETTASELIGSEPTFGPRIFFLFVFVMMVLSLISFILLHNLDQCKRERVLAHANGSGGGDSKRYSVDMYEVIPTERYEMSRFTYFYLMLLIGAISFIGYGVFPGLQSYSCRPYGVMAYHLAAALSAFANPFACITAMFWSSISLKNLFAQSATIAVISGYLLYTAIQSPSPPFVGTLFGNVLIVS